MLLRILAVALLPLITACAGQNQQTSASDICQHYDWGKVEALVRPHLDSFLMTAFVMQGPSANYRTSEAAIQARADIQDKRVRKILNDIVLANCE